MPQDDGVNWDQAHSHHLHTWLGGRATVILAPILYIKVVTVKKLLVELLAGWSAQLCVLSGWALNLGEPASPSLGASGNQDLYLEKIRVFKAGLCQNTLAWNNKLGCVVLFCWFLELPQWLTAIVGGFVLRSSDLAGPIGAILAHVPFLPAFEAFLFLVECSPFVVGQGSPGTGMSRGKIHGIRVFCKTLLPLLFGRALVVREFSDCYFS